MGNYGRSVEKKRVLVVLHVYYEQLVDYYLDCLKNINGCEWDLTVTGHGLGESTRRKVLALKPDASFIETANKGYDVWPFICAIKQTDLDRYSFVIKLHTKNQDGRKTCINGIQMNGEEWRSELVDTLLGSEDRFRNLSKIFRTRRNVGLAYSMTADRRVGLRTMEDTELLDSEMARLSIRPRARRFCAGTMFAVRASALKWLMDERISEDIFRTSGASHAAGTMAHTYERLLCLAVTAQGYSTARLKNSLGRYIYLKSRELTQPSLEWMFSIRYLEDRCKYLTVCGFHFRLSAAQ